MARRTRRTVSGKDNGSGNNAAARQARYRHLRHPFTPQRLFSDDEISALHEKALQILETLGIRFPLPEARDLFAAAGASITDDYVFIGRDIVAAALQTAPTAFTLMAPNPARNIIYDKGALIFSPAGGCPNVFDSHLPD